MPSAPDVDTLAAKVPDGSLLSWPVDYAGSPVALAHALVRKGARNLRLQTIPASGYAADLLIGAGCVAEIETSGVSLNEFGPANRFAKAVKSGTIRIKDATCPAVHAELQAAQKGVPFVPMRGIIGSDILKNRDDWKQVDNPFGDNDPIVLVPAVRADFACFHAALADANGNVWVGRRGELKTQAHAAAASLVTVEALYDGDLLEHDTYAAGTIPALYLEAVALAPQGAWPCGFWYEDQPVDEAQMQLYAKASRTDEGFQSYLNEYVYGRRRAAAE